MNDKTKTKAYYEKGKLVKLERATRGSPHTRTRAEKQKVMLKEFAKARKPSGRINEDDLKRAAKRLGYTLTKKKD